MISIIAVMAVMMVGVLNPAVLSNKANDARRKKDIGRIKVAFEEYFNDKGCFPTRDFVDSHSTCNTAGFAPWLSSWPCDPAGGQYRVVVDTATCPLYFKIYTNLQNKQDGQIPSGWYDGSSLTYHFGDGTLTKEEANYGVSSTNVNWYDQVLDPRCIDSFGGCYIKNAEGGSCQATPLDAVYNNAYTDVECSPQCFVACCFKGKLCN